MSERNYYTERAERQLRLAQRTADPRVCRSHFILANLLLERAAGADGAEVRGR